MQQLFIFGTGSHARKVFHYATSLGWTVVGFIDESSNAQAPISGFPIITYSELSAQNQDVALFVAIGNPEVRARLMDKFSENGWTLPSIVHQTAYVAPDVDLGEGVLISAGAIVETGATISRGSIVDVGVIIDHDAKVKEFSHLRPGQICGPGQYWPSN